MSLGNYLPSLGFSFWMSICLFPALCYEPLNGFPQKILTVQWDDPVNSLHVSSNSFIRHPAPSGVLAEMPGKWEHAMLCQSEIPKSVLRVHSPPCLCFPVGLVVQTSKTSPRTPGIPVTLRRKGPESKELCRGILMRRAGCSLQRRLRDFCW